MGLQKGLVKYCFFHKVTKTDGTLENMAFRLKVRTPTHILGGAIDHLYIREKLDTTVICQMIIHPLYFSDHDAVCSLMKFN